MEKTYLYEQELLNAIGKIYKDLRCLKHKTQQELACGLCSRNNISDIENGKQKIPNIIILNRLAQKLGVGYYQILEKAENEVNNTQELAKRKIINLLTFSKYQEANNLASKYLINKSEENFKYKSFILGSRDFYNHQYISANQKFISALDSLKNITKNTILSYIDIFLMNGYISSLLQYCRKEFLNEKTLQFLYILKNSIEYYLAFETRSLIRLKIYLFDYFRLFARYDVCEKLLNEIEPVIDECAFYENKTELALALIPYYIQINKEYKIREVIEKTRTILEMYDLSELSKHFEKAITDFDKALNAFQ